MFDALDGSRSDESQASQLLRAALRQGVEVPADPKLIIAPARKSPNNLSLADASPFSSSEERPLPQYQLHGLDSTTPSQSFDRHDGEDSQKENDPALYSEPVRHLPAAHSAPLTKRAQRKPAFAAQDERRHSPTRSSRAPVVSDNHLRSKDVPPMPPSTGIKGQKAVSFISPVPSPQSTPHRNTTARAMTAPSRRLPARSPSPASQDSFAGPLPEADQQRHYIRTSRIFQVPLSEIGEDPEEVSNLTADSASKPSAMSLRNHIRRSPSPLSEPPSSVEKLLITSTPSASPEIPFTATSERKISEALIPCGDTQVSESYSQEQAQQAGNMHHSNPPNAIEQPDFAVQQVPSQDASTQPSLSYQRVLDINPFESSPVPTQAQVGNLSENLTPTQPSSYVAPSISLDTSAQTGTADVSHASEPALSQSVANTSTTIGTRRGNLLGLVHPEKRWRLQVHGINPTGRFTVENAMELADSIAFSGDTQPSDAAVHGSASTTAPTAAGSSGQLRSTHIPAANAHATLAARSGHPTNPILPPLQPAPVQRAQPCSEIDIVPETVLAGGDEGDTDKEDEVPLAQTVARTRGQKGKGKSKAADISTAPAAPTQPPRTTAGTKGPDEPVRKVSNPRPSRPPSRPTSKSDGVKQVDMRSWEAGVVPSSMPHQDIAQHPPAAGPSTSNPAVKKVTQVPRSKAAAKSRSSTPAHKRPRLPSEVTSPSEGATAVTGDEDAAIPGVGDEGDDITEPADDEHMDVDEGDYAPAKATSSRKRKRTVSTSSRKTAPRGAVRPTRSTTGTPLNKAVKKRSVSSSVLLEQNPDATRVFALWKQDNHYYTGIVHSMASDNPPRYLIKFDDNTEDRVDATKLRMCLLKAGDHVMMGTNMRAIVVEDTMSGATDVCVRFNNSDDDDAMVVPLNNVRIASRTLLSRFKDRVLDPKDIIPAIGPAPFKPSPSPNRLSLASDGSAKGNRKLFSKTGLVVTLGPGNDDWERVKDRLMLSIRNHGGAVVEDWCDIFTLDGTFSQGNKRWIGEKDDIRWIERDDIDRVFLLSDDANQKPKFLIALALGIPCLSTEWLEVSINERTERDWQAYLLPAGFCDPLNARVSQLVDLDWGNSVEHLTEIMSNLVPSKLFADQSILCLSPEFMPAPPKASRKVRESGGMVPKIILCMGASRVEAVADARHATHPDLNKYDYVIVKEQSEVYRVSSTKGANCVHFGWVKDCLIAGRLLPRSSC